MKNSVMKFLILICSFCSFALGENSIKCQLSLVAFGDESVGSTLYFKDEEAVSYNKIRCLSSDVSKPITYSGSRLFALYKKEEGKEANYRKLANVKIPAGLKRGIMILLSSKSQKKRVLVVDGSLKTFPPGSRVLMNLTDRSIRGIVAPVGIRSDKEKVQYIVKPKKSTVVSPLNPNGKQIQAHISIVEYKQDKTESWRMLRSSRWFQIQGQRQIIVIFESNGQFRMKGIIDSHAQAAPKKK